MKITIVSLYLETECEYCLGAIEGSLDDGQRRALAAQFRAEYNPPEEVDDGKYMYFREVDTVPEPSQLDHLLSMDDDGVCLNEFAPTPRLRLVQS